MDQAWPLHSLGKSNDILGADNVGSQAAFQGRIEGDVSGRVDDNVDIFRDRFSLFFAKPEIVFCDVATDDCDLISDEIFERRAVAFAYGIEWRRTDDVVPKARFRFFLRTRAHRDVDAADAREAVQQHAQRDFAEKARTAD